jgi:hypothetical protein
MKLLQWTYRAVVRPIITYVNSVWRPRVKFKTCRVEFRTLQRLDCVGIARVPSTIQTAGNDGLLVLLPLHLKMEPEV